MEINRSAPNLSSKTSNLIVLLNLSGLTAMGPDDLVYFIFFTKLQQYLSQISISCKIKCKTMAQCRHISLAELCLKILKNFEHFKAIKWSAFELNMFLY